MSMKQGPGSFRARSGAPIVAAALAIALALPAGCAGGVRIEDAVPVGALPPPSSPPPTTTGAATAPATQAQTAPATALVEGTGPSAPRNTGQFPNLNVAPTPAAAQFTPAEARSTAQDLRNAARAQAGGGGVSAAESAREAARLRQLGRTRAAEVLKEIEGE
jgi:hypothetical protein